MRWTEEFVVAHGLCPFAARPLREGRVTALELEGADVEELFYAALTQVQGLVQTAVEETETTLLVLPDHLGDFDDFLAFVGAIEEALEESGAHALVQLAHFHPDYRFAGVDRDDPGNRTNRAPWPVVQLLRVASVARAVAAYPDVEGIPGRNVARMRKLFGGV